MEYEVFEVREYNFPGDDGTVVTGSYYYLLADGSDSKRVFVPNSRLKDFAYKPKKGDKVLCFWGGKDGTSLVDFLRV